MNTERYLRRLRPDLDRWAAQGIISEQQAAAILADVRSRRWSSSRSVAIAGALLFGLGLISWFAWNWQDMHRYTKLALWTAAFLGSHLAGYSYHRRGFQQMSTALHLLGTFLFGGGIWLTGQIYHLDAHYPTPILLWACIAIAFGWLLHSAEHGLLASVLFSVWAASKIGDFQTTAIGAEVLILATVITLAIKLQHAGLFRVSLISLCAIHIAGVIHVSEDLLFAVFMLYASALASLGTLFSYSRFKNSGAIAARIGLIGTLAGLGLASFSDVESVRLLSGPEQPFTSERALIALICAGTGLVYSVKSRRPVSSYIVPGLTTLWISWSMLGPLAEHWLWAFANVALLIQGGLWIRDARISSHPTAAREGVTIIALVAITRFIDLSDDLQLRAEVFLVIGALMLFIARRQANKERK